MLTFVDGAEKEAMLGVSCGASQSHPPGRLPLLRATSHHSWPSLTGMDTQKLGAAPNHEAAPPLHNLEGTQYGRR